jgi:tRNA synthetases class I (I, L, M and V)
MSKAVDTAATTSSAEAAAWMAELSVAVDNSSNAAAAAAAATGEANKRTSTVKRDALRNNEIAVQKAWDEAGVFEADYCVGSNEEEKTFFVTFPYPYSNGHLHIGHAFSLTKAVFRAQYERHRGRRVLFPFAFHCTGMPIQAVRTVRCVALRGWLLIWLIFVLLLLLLYCYCFCRFVLCCCELQKAIDRSMFILLWGYPLLSPRENNT